MSTVESLAKEFSERMCVWFEACGRDLPWRHSPSPYEVWVSEIMLQQTQVVTVIPYYERWMRRFPDLLSLAEASLEDVFQVWSGLGYYRRARYLHAGAQKIVSEYGGEFPRTISELLRIPGIGAYTAGAIASFAFGQDEPAIDGNVQRVLARVFGITDDLSGAKGRQMLEKVAREVAHHGHCSHVNQAMMDLGASFCGKAALCDGCPLKTMCFACRNMRTESIPYKKARVEKYDVFCAALRIRDREGRYLIGRRRGDILLGGLWEYPMIELSRGKGEAHRREGEMLLRRQREGLWCMWLEKKGIEAGRRDVKKVREIHHTFTHIELRAELDEMEWGGVQREAPQGDEKYELFKWVKEEEIESQQAISSLMKKLM